MKRSILFVACIASFFTGYSQSLYPSIIQYPLTGVSKLTAENPYVVQQVKDSFGDWLNSAKFFWEPSALPGYKKYSGNFRWTNNEWHEVYSNTDSFVMNNDNLISVAIEKTIYDYPGYSRKDKFRYTYTYNTDKTVSTIKMDLAANFNSNTYSPYNFTKIFYDNNGKRIYDSIRSYSQGTFTQFVRYQYNSLNQPVAEYGVNASTGDTFARTFYSYEGNMLKTLYSESFDETTDDWGVQNADSMEISNGRVTNRIMYGLYIEDGVVSVRPSSNESYTYNTDGSPNTIVTQRWEDSVWYDFTRLELLYSNGKPMLAPVYYAVNGVFETAHSMQYIFNFLSGVNEQTNTTTINNMYPNPASNQLNVTLDHANNAIYSVFDLAGKLVEKGNTGSDNLILNLDNYTNGVYYLNITSNERTSTRKFVVSK